MSNKCLILRISLRKFFSYTIWNLQCNQRGFSQDSYCFIWHKYRRIYISYTLFFHIIISLFLRHTYSVDQYENVKKMKNTFYQIHLPLFKILFGLRLKKTWPFFIHCSFKCSILSWSIFEYPVSFLTDKIKFRIFFLDGIILFLLAFLNPPNMFYLTKYATLH